MNRSKTTDPFKAKRIPVPRDVRQSAFLWLDLFQMFCSDVLDAEQSQELRHFMVSQAADLADHALKRFEERWPGVKVPE